MTREHFGKRRTLLALSALTLASMGVAATAFAGPAAASATSSSATPGWPNKPLRIVVGFPGGSSSDLTARTFSEPLAKMLGQPVIIENKVGAGGNIGADYVAKAKDDHTIGLFINGNLTTANLINSRVPYNPQKDLAPLTLVGTSPLVLTAPVHLPDAPDGTDARAFLAAAKKAGDKWSYGTPGVGTVGHIGTELMKARTGIAPVHVPYPGYPQVAQAMLGGQLQMALLPPALALAQHPGSECSQPGGSGCARFESGDVERVCRTGVDAREHSQSPVHGIDGNRTRSRGAHQAVSARLASRGFIARRSGQPHQERYRNDGQDHQGPEHPG